MRKLLIISLTLISFSAMSQKLDTLSTPIKLGANNLLRLKQLDNNQRKYDSLINVQRNEILDVILSAHGLELKDVVKIEPKENGVVIFKTKKK